MNPNSRKLNNVARNCDSTHKGQQKVREHLFLASLSGILLSILMPFLLLNSRIYSGPIWFILAPGWILFSPGRDDLGEMIMAFVFDAIFYGLIIYVIVRFLSKMKNRFQI
jgi:hypothetical protein